MRTNKPLVSIVVPSFNQAHYLETALTSIMFQDYPNIEIIICNHGSTDNTSDVIAKFVWEAENNAQVSFLEYYDHNQQQPFVRKYLPKFPSGRTITVIESKINIGGTASYNVGFRKISGKYCTYLVGDDYFLPNAISEMVDVLETGSCDFVYADMFVVTHNGAIIQHLKKPDYSFKACFADWFHIGVCRLYRKKLHDQYGLFDESYRNANDYDMYLRFAMNGARFKHIPKTLYCVRQHSPDSKSEPASWRNNGYQNLLRESVLCCKRARDFLKNSRGDL